MLASPDLHFSSASESPESGYNSLTSDTNMQQEQSHWIWQNSLLHEAARGAIDARTGSATNFLPSSSFTAPSLHVYDNIGQSSGLQNGSYADSLGATGGSIDFNPQQNEKLSGMYGSLENGMQPFNISQPYQVLPSQAGGSAFSSLHSAHPNVPAPPPAPQASHRLKRKACDRAPWEDPEPVKIRVNEDRMASCLNDLNLDNNNSSSQPDLEDSAWYHPISDNEASYPFARAAVADYFDGSSSSSNIEALRSSDAHPHRRRIVITDKSTIEICPGLQVEPTSKDFIPKLIQDELNKANMQLAIWHPPESIFQSYANGGSSNADSSHKTQSSSSSSCTSSDSSDDERQNRLRVRCKQLNPAKESNKAEEERTDLNEVSMDF